MKKFNVKMKNPFYFHRNRRGIWVFGDTWLTDMIGGLLCIVAGIVCALTNCRHET